MILFVALVERRKREEGRECCNLDECLFCGVDLRDRDVRRRRALRIDILVVVKKGEVVDLEIYQYLLSITCGGVRTRKILMLINSACFWLCISRCSIGRRPMPHKLIPRFSNKLRRNRIHRNNCFLL